MGVLHIWALGVGVVITGEYFGWNQGLKEGGPVGMLLASLFVCALYMMWVLALSELSVAMPFAGGPLAYGRRAVGPTFGFVMGWSMFLEALFAAIGTAMATGGYIYSVLSPLLDDGSFKLDQGLTATLAGLATVVVFAVVQWVGSKRQAQLMEWMTYGAILGLVWFWIACIPGVRLERIFTKPLLTAGWTGVLKAIPYAIWWLVMIETVALAPEEAHEPHRTIPRGMTLAQITLIVLVLLTWFFAAAAGTDYRKTGDDEHVVSAALRVRRGLAEIGTPDRLLGGGDLRHDRELQRHDLRGQPAVVRVGPGRLPAASPRPRPPRAPDAGRVHLLLEPGGRGLRRLGLLQQVGYRHRRC